MFKRSCATLVFFLLCFSALHAGEPPSRNLAGHFTLIDSPSDVPDLLFRDGEGRTHTLLNFIRNDLKGRYVLLNVWATWCAPCLDEMPSLDALQAAMASRGLTVIALAEDQEGAVSVPAFYRRQGLTHLKVYLDPSGLAIRRLRLRGIPTSLLINPQGQLIGRAMARVDWSTSDNIAFLEKIIASGSTDH
jgi:thiol-disulfide isomerase/thioredoxin